VSRFFAAVITACGFFLTKTNLLAYALPIVPLTLNPACRSPEHRIRRDSGFRSTVGAHGLDRRELGNCTCGL